MIGNWLRQSALAVATAGVVFAGAMVPASAQIGPRPPVLRPCPPTGACWYYTGRIVLPANALGRTPQLTPIGRGLDWPTNTGYVTVVVPKPLDYRGGAVRVGVFYYVTGGGDGTVGVAMLPVGLRPGGPYETYGGDVSSLEVAQYDTHYEQWVVLPTVNTGFSGESPWWHVEITRRGTFDDRITLLAAVVEYR